ncbi:Acetyltransferase (GNAT) family protein [Flavobacterium segetis]|uniref:Acetyltransferase (GNAT) family protein n=1 Tax=Flavobacterium segetis TaxID=271157 RepID=A0A1M5IA58_9FLAO|nr:GNAT family N-acetyltransferase [Flavobacterium segetis]SHG24959.1 Acetyltransferase (GNAT) family protein [Flavobacterium segetis]
MILEKNVEIIPFTAELKEHIKILNSEWLNKYFKIEPKDEIVLSNPQTEIIDKGGFIFYAKNDGQIIGTYSLLKIDDFTFELSKMAVTKAAQGMGIAKTMLAHCLAFAKDKKIKNLILYSNRSLNTALHLYKKFGFIEVALECGVYERADVKMELVISAIN